MGAAFFLAMRRLCSDCCLVVALVLVPICGVAQQDASLEQVAAAADPAVGRVLVVSQELFVTGSGFVLGPGRDHGTLLFLTNHHVVEGGKEVYVGFQKDGEVFPYRGKVIALSERLDLAVLSLTPEQDVSRHEVRPLAIRSELARKGESVVALGFPGSADTLGINLEDPDYFISTLTSGTVSKTMRASWQEGTPQSERFEIVQHTASINPGTSGGPLLDMCANVVGLNTGVAAVMEDGFQPNDTYWANSAPVVADFLRQENIPFQEASACTNGPTVVSPEQQPSTTVAERAFGMPTWAVAAICLVLVGVFIGGIVAIGHVRPKAAAISSSDAAEALPGAAEVTLTLQFSGGAQHEIVRQALEKGVRIGRGPEADIRCNAAGISRQHAMLHIKGRRLLLTDLGSTNRTLVDGRALVPNRPVAVSSASHIVLGGETLLLSQGSSQRGFR